MVDVRESIQQALEDTARFWACFLSWAQEEDRHEMMSCESCGSSGPSIDSRAR